MDCQRLCVATTVLLLFAGCVPSLNPVYNDQTLVFDPEVLGVWGQQGNEATWKLTAKGEKQYSLVHTEKDGQRSRFIARVAEVAGTRFLDLYPEEMAIDSNGLGKAHLVAIHTIYLVRRTSPTAIEMAAIDYRQMVKYIEQHPDSIEHATFDDRMLITAQTDALQQFLLAHKDMFTGTVTLKRRADVTN